MKSTPDVVRTGIQLGNRDPGHKYIWAACIDCGKERWVQFRSNKLEHERCNACARKKSGHCMRGELSPNWKGGRKVDYYGYILVYLPEDSPYLPMADSNRFVLEHRLNVAKALERCLRPEEIIHHRNGIRSDNRYPENLEIVVGKGRHNGHVVCPFCLKEFGLL